VRVPGEARLVVSKPFSAEIVKKEKGVENIGIAKAEGPSQAYARAF
jgi:hypothetical protein